MGFTYASRDFDSSHESLTERPMTDCSPPLPRRPASTTFFLRVVLLTLVSGLLCGAVRAQTAGSGAPPESSAVQVAPVAIDGETLFLLRGIIAYPAAQRVAVVRDRIIAAAKDPAITGDDVRVVEKGDKTLIYAGDTVLLDFLKADAEIEHAERHTLAGAYRDTIANAILRYRRDRSPAVLMRRTAFALGVTLVSAVLLWGTLKCFTWLDRGINRKVAQTLQRLGDRAHPLVYTGQIWGLLRSISRLARNLILIIFGYFYLNTVLGLYPWTRPAANILLSLILQPLQRIGQSLLDAVPDIAFLVILYLLVRYLLKVMKTFFDGVAHQRIRLENFDPDWAEPTYKITRVLVIIAALVIAYPYIPGSDSLAFKGVSVFVGVLISLGSSSFIANVIAGIMMTYRGAFKVGERVQIGDTVGTVEDIRLMVTRLRTPKNELVVIPNSNILETNVVNYSICARQQGVILNTTVGIGYDVPWRQVEAMLLLAVARTDGLKTDPPPYVRQRLLGDFAVVYEINAFCGDAHRLNSLYSKIHANIQDVFNEHGVQIMSPAYVADPAEPKLVPPENWYPEPAVQPAPNA
jgi:small-conductance mechanosensitive channel